MHNRSGFMLFLAIVFLTVSCNKSATEVGRKVENQPKSLFEGQVWETDKLLATIALGSCNRQDEPQPMWPYIIENEPDLWIWLGDNIYGDTEDMDVMKSKYILQKSNPGYRLLRNQCPVIGIWDDHDYGVNDGGKEFARKEESKHLMLDFLDVPADAPARKRPGAHQSYTFGPNGLQVKVILLDARYFRDDLLRSNSVKKRYVPNPEGDILGAAQWAWLEKELTDSKAQIHLIGSGIQIIPEEHGFEKWANLPQARTRLFELLAKTRPAYPILLSGDRHIAEISKLQIDGLQQPVYEITSSGLTHSYERVGEEPNRHRVGKIVGQKNFGLLRIDWSREKPEITLEVRGLENVVYLQTVF